MCWAQSLAYLHEWLLVSVLFLCLVTTLSNKLSPWSRVLIEKLTVTQLVKKYPDFYATRRFITVFTTAYLMSLSWARWIHSTAFHPISIRSSLILCTHLRLGLTEWPLLFKFSDQYFVFLLFLIFSYRHDVYYLTFELHLFVIERHIHSPY
jgi:hypothetical protein